jgi:hypothetical protein
MAAEEYTALRLKLDKYLEVLLRFLRLSLRSKARQAVVPTARAVACE